MSGGPFTLVSELRCRTLAALLTLTLCAACGGGGGGDGSGGGGIGLADGDDPDPVAVDFPVAYVKRSIPVDEDGALLGSDAREQIVFEPGAELFVRDRASPSAPETNVTFELTTEGPADIRDLDVSYDGERLVFAMRWPFDENVDEEDQPTWNLWQYDFTTAQLRRLITSDITAEAGHDRMPRYLPDGRIIFTSTRQRRSRAILLDEGKPQYAALDEDRNEPAFLLHVMNDDGSDIRQVSFNQSHDIHPTVASDGRIVFTRWDNAVNNDAMHLYRMRPDGGELELLYGARSHFTGTDGEEVHFIAPKELPDGSMMSLIRPFEADSLGGDLISIDTGVYVENEQPTAANAGLAGPAQRPLTVNAVRTDDLPSPGGRYSSAFPLNDGSDRLLVSWSQCRLVEVAVEDEELVERIVPCTADRLEQEDAVAAPPLYGLWIYDQREETQLPVVAPEEGVMYSEIVAAQPRPTPPVLFDGGADGPDQVLVEEGVGLINIRSVYDFNGEDTVGLAALADPAQTTADQRPARFLRVTKPVSLPDDEVLDIPRTAFGRSAAQGMREIVAYAPIEPDGSVRIKVPADVALAVSVLDRDGRRISPRHHNWMQVRPGQELRCNGCHQPDSPLSHGRAGAFEAANAGATTTGVPFPNTVEALFADFGETMAEARSRNSCATEDCIALQPSVDLVYSDVWTDPVAAGRDPDDAFAYRYADLQTPPPTSQACITRWNAGCRIVVNYEAHIHPLWGLPRQTLDDDGVTVLADFTCNTCHGTTDAMGEVQVPAAQLDLGDGPSDQEMDHFKSYRELLFGDNEQEVVEGVLLDRLVEIGIDPDTDEPILVTVPVAPSMNVGGARASARFFDRFAPGGTHAGWLSPAELRLLSEWLDVGGQYFNNPFDVPID